MNFHPPFFVFCSLGLSVMIISVLLAVAAEQMDHWLTRKTAVLTSRRPIAHRHTETSHFL
ncbi:hypothetical protein [Paraburkholderia sp. C35]|uniref:hypothetical protein n=1 Tax=Paraburkholderia sp. C35 TaxID=2126993 RepID=UPI0013A56288|nr:hypothetical protein [Paraburkholderia sp. C35]